MRKLLLVLVSIVLGLVLIILVVSWNAGHHFGKKVSSEVTELFSKGSADHRQLVAGDLASLPEPVRRWITSSGAVGKELARTTRLKQEGSMLSKPDGSWVPFEAVQYFTFDPPAFIWKADVRVAPLVRLAGRDKYEDGRGNMLIKLLSLITLADAEGSELDQGELVRFLSEIAWTPSAALGTCITWEPIDSVSARATMNWGGVKVSGIFRFNADGDVVAFEAMRYADFGGKYSLEQWSVSLKGHRSFDGVRIPSEGEVTWKLKGGDFTWLRFTVKDLEYNNAAEY